jgi:hypothetical protein
MQLIEVIDAARTILNEPLDASRTFPDNTSSFYADTALTTYHNLIQTEIQNELIQSHENFFVTQTSINFVADQADYPLPSSCIQIIRVEDIRNASQDPTEIRPITIGNRGGFQGVTALSGTSYDDGFYIVGTRLHFGFTPTLSQQSAVRVFYVKALSGVSASTDSSELPVEYHQALVWGIVKYALLQQQADTTKADLEFEKLIAKMRKQSEDRQVQRPRKVRIKQGI